MREYIEKFDNPEKKKTNLNVEEFYAEPLRYASNLVAYGIWYFEIKFSKKENIPPYALFGGVYVNGFISFLVRNGYYKRYYSESNKYFFLSCIDNIIEEFEEVNIKDFVNIYLENEGKEINFKMKIQNQEIEFIASLELQTETIKRQCHFLFSEKFLENLPTFDKEILRDTPKECFKLFENGVFKIGEDGYEIMNYADLHKCVWKKHIIPFTLEFTPDFLGSHFYKFIRNVSNADKDEDRNGAFITALGYLQHNYNAPEKGQAVILYDEQITDKDVPEGGTGKGVYAKALKEVTDMVIIDGKKFDPDERFCFQQIKNSTQIVFFDDVKPIKNVFDRFNSLLTEGWTIEKKNKDEVTIPPKETPKVVIASNSILDCEGNTRRRRQFTIEFSDYYSKQQPKIKEPIKEEHGCIFFSEDWNELEWQKFYSFMLNCVCIYMKNGLHYYEPKNIKKNRLRQITNDDFEQWVTKKNFENNKSYTKNDEYMDFKLTYYGDGDQDKFSKRLFNSYLKKYASINEWTFWQDKDSFKFISETEQQQF